MPEQPYIQKRPAAGREEFSAFLRAVLEALSPLPERCPAYERAGIPARLSRPERAASFAVSWTDDSGRVRVTDGRFVRYSTASGPCRCEFILRPGLEEADLLRRGLEAALSNSLAGLPLGGGAAGADIDPASLSDGESLRFCQSFMTGLYPLLAGPVLPDWDSIGLARRERDYLRGQYDRLAACVPGRYTPPEEGAASLFPAQAAGYGLCYIARSALRRRTGARLEGRTVVIAGQSGPAAWAGEKAFQMGAQVVVLGQEDSFLHAPAGLPLALLRAVAEAPGEPLTAADGTEGREGDGSLWDVPADVYILCDPAHPLDADGAGRILSHRPACVLEGRPAACSAAAARRLVRSGVLFVPAVAAGVGDAVLFRLRRRFPELTGWDADKRLRAAMQGVFRSAWDAAETSGSLARGALSCAVLRLADALLRRG